MVGAPEFEVIKFVSFGHLCRTFHNRLTAIRKTETSMFYVKSDLNTDLQDNNLNIIVILSFKE